MASINESDEGAQPDLPSAIRPTTPQYSLAVFAPAISSPSPPSPTDAKNDPPAIPTESPVAPAPNNAKISSKSRKKGTAVKKPSSKRKVGGGGGAGGAGAGAGVKSKSKKVSTTKQLIVNQELPQATGEKGTDEADGESEDNGPYCICRGPDDHRWMIGCECCDEWFHGECIGLTKDVGEKLVERFVCPNCTNEEEKIVTIYRQTCAFDGCKRLARLYDSYPAVDRKGNAKDIDNIKNKQDDNAASMQKISAFCSDDHRDTYWDQVIASLPKDQTGIFHDELTQQQVMALLVGGKVKIDPGFPFNGDPFDPKRAPNAPLNPEEEEYIKESEADRREMGEEIGILKKMLKLLELSANRKMAAVEAGRFEKDMCGYDVRLDFIGEAEAFKILAQCPDMEPLFKPSSGAQLGPPRPLPPELAENLAGYHRFEFPESVEEGSGTGLYGTDPLAGGMCTKKRCRPHAGWLATHARNIKHIIGYLAERAAAKLEEERKIKDHASVRYLRKSHEENEVEVLEGEYVFRNRPRDGLMIDAMTGERLGNNEYNPAVH